LRGSSGYSADELLGGLTDRDLDEILGPGGQATGEDPDLTTFLDQCVALGEAAKRLRERIRNTPNLGCNRGEFAVQL